MAHRRGDAGAGPADLGLGAQQDHDPARRLRGAIVRERGAQAPEQAVQRREAAAQPCLVQVAQVPVCGLAGR